MKIITILPLIAAALALGLMLISPPPVEARWAYGGYSQGHGYNHLGGRAEVSHNFDRANNQQWTKNSLNSQTKQFQGARRDPATGIWNPYR